MDALKSNLAKTKILSSNLLDKIKFTNITEETPFSSITIRHLLRKNKMSLKEISIEYKTDMMREETRILVDEIGLEEFPVLELLRFRMNRSYLLAEQICPYFIR